MAPITDNVNNDGDQGGATVKSMCIVNAIYNIDLHTIIDLEEMHRKLTSTLAMTGKPYCELPQMLLVYLPFLRRNIHIFRYGTLNDLPRAASASPQH